MNVWVQYVWVVPALPLAAMLIILGITRPLDLRQRRLLAMSEHGGQPAGETAGTPVPHDHRSAGVGQPGQPAGPGGPRGGHDVDTLAGAHGAGGALEIDHLRAAMAHDAHEEHGHPPTPFWAAVGGWIGFFAAALAFCYAMVLLFEFTIAHPSLQHDTLQNAAYDIHLYDWFSFGTLRYVIDFHVDPLTVVMLIVVTSVSALVQLYSMGYMQGEPGYSRFYIELSLFTLSMLILVLAANFLVIFIGWELVGLSSYLLIGFWYERTDPPPAALKAFVTTRLGDFGFMIGLLIIFFQTGTFNFANLNNTAISPFNHVSQPLITLAMILVFCGAVGKSAQFPLHVWLPDAMEGPTPVSALIHAATMVAAGVYLVARLFPIYSHFAGPQSLEVVGYVGGFTALFAATIALVQNDIKRVLAYSTVSQLGYMFVGLAVADTNSVGIFHLFTHAFFKALLFLGSGSVIHAVANQDMRNMGGLARRMPWTAGTFLIATLSISGFPFFAGFFSKDAIIGTAYEYGTAHGGNYVLYGMTLFTAFLTAFYMFRLYYLTFGGRGGSLFGLFGGDAHYRGDQPAHESPWTMTVPLALLAIPSALAGYLAFAGFGTFLQGGQPVLVPNPFADVLTYVGIAVAILGIVVAWLMYGTRRVVISPTWYRAVPGGTFAYNVLAQKYYLDELYLWLIRIFILGLSNAAAWFDAHIIDGLLHGTRDVVLGLGTATSKTESGRLQNYAAALFGGAIILAIALFISAAYLAGH